MTTLYSHRTNHFATWENCRSKPQSAIRGDLVLAGLYRSWSGPEQDFYLGPNHLGIDWYGPNRVPHRLSVEVVEGTITLEVISQGEGVVVPSRAWSLENPQCIVEIMALVRPHGLG